MKEKNCAFWSTTLVTRIFSTEVQIQVQSSTLSVHLYLTIQICVRLSSFTTIQPQNIIDITRTPLLDTLIGKKNEINCSAQEQRTMKTIICTKEIRPLPRTKRQQKGQYSCIGLLNPNKAVERLSLWSFWTHFHQIRSFQSFVLYYSKQ